MKMKKTPILSALLALTLCVCACGTPDRSPKSPTDRTEAAQTADSSAPPPATGPSTQAEENQEREPDEAMKMKVQIGDHTFVATLEENAAVRELIQMMRQSPVAVEMRDYSGFEKVGSLGRSLPADDSRTTTHSGDIVLYNGDQIVIFYGSNSWSYTRLGHIDDLTGWSDALGNGPVTAIFTLSE